MPASSRQAKKKMALFPQREEAAAGASESSARSFLSETDPARREEITILGTVPGVVSHHGVPQVEVVCFCSCRC